MKEKLNRAISLRSRERFIESNKLLLELVNGNENDAILHYQVAWSYDLLGEEAKAAPYYEKAIELGLPDKNLLEALTGLGSTYRSLGEYEKSKNIFEKGLKLFPDCNALKVFFSMTLYNLNEHHRAMELLLQCLIDTTSDQEILIYKKAIQFYRSRLDEVWK